MKRLAHARSRDANEKEIVDALEAIGATVLRLDDFDLLVGYKGVDVKVEVKNPSTDWKLETNQKKFINEWRGSSLHIVTNADQAIQIIQRAARVPQS